MEQQHHSARSVMNYAQALIRPRQPPKEGTRGRGSDQRMGVSITGRDEPSDPRRPSMQEGRLERYPDDPDPHQITKRKAIGGDEEPERVRHEPERVRNESERVRESGRVRHEPDVRQDRWSKALGIEPSAEPPKPEVTIGDYRELNVKLHKSEGTVRELQTQVYELQKTITHLNRRDGEASKDDSYFSNKFSVVADSIVQWVLANFRGASKAETKPEWSLLSLDVKKYLEPYKSSGLFKSRQTRLRVVGGIVAEILRTQIFDCFIFGAPGSGSQFEDTQRQLKGTDYQIQRWRALTVNLYTQNADFQTNFDKRVRSIANDLETLLVCFAPEESNDENRRNGLHQLVNEAAVLALEVRGQSHLIELLPVDRGNLYSQFWMNDLNCEYEENELEAGKATVRLQVFPIVVRRGFDPEGAFWAQVSVVMKGSVLASLAE